LSKPQHRRPPPVFRQGPEKTKRAPNLFSVTVRTEQRFEDFLVLQVPEGPGMLPEIVFPIKITATSFFENFPPIFYFLLRVRPHRGWSALLRLPQDSAQHPLHHADHALCRQLTTTPAGKWRCKLLLQGAQALKPCLPSLPALPPLHAQICNREAHTYPTQRVARETWR